MTSSSVTDDVTVGSGPVWRHRVAVGCRADDWVSCVSGGATSVGQPADQSDQHFQRSGRAEEKERGKVSGLEGGVCVCESCVGQVELRVPCAEIAAGNA